MDEKFIKKLMSTIKCGVCGQRYESSNVTVLGQRSEMWFLSVVCPACHSQAVVAAVIKEAKPAEIITDLTEAELTKFAQGDAIGADDVLDVHNFLKSFNGNFSKLFNKD